MDFNSTSFMDVLLWSLMFFVWIAALSVWFRCLFDMFSDDTLSGWGKAGWTVVLVFLWFLGALIYLIARGRSMQERATSRALDQQRAQAQYIRQAAGDQNSPADQIARGKALLESGVITEAEFASLKAKALA